MDDNIGVTGVEAIPVKSGGEAVYNAILQYIQSYDAFDNLPVMHCRHLVARSKSIIN